MMNQINSTTYLLFDYLFLAGNEIRSNYICPEIEITIRADNIDGNNTYTKPCQKNDSPHLNEFEKINFFSHNCLFLKKCDRLWRFKTRLIQIIIDEWRPLPHPATL
ncbi:MAG: hypothetical protein NTU74_18765, partial [Deltaproteobacteria bacterium]|nr:hypothetical protein [Deltaproteobacteria bacterium]